MDDSSIALLGIALAAAVPIFVLIGVIIKTQAAHGATQKLILEKLDAMTTYGQDIAVLKNDVINIYKRFERKSA